MAQLLVGVEDWKCGGCHGLTQLLWKCWGPCFLEWIESCHMHSWLHVF